MESAVNMRSKRTESENAAVVALWENRRSMVFTRKDYEIQIEKLNTSIQKEIKKMLEPVCTQLDIPTEFIIESGRCVVQIKLYSVPKAKGSWFVTDLSQSIAPLDTFLKTQASLKQLPIVVKKSLRRMKKIANMKLGRTISPTDTNPAAKIQGPKRRPDEPMIVVSYNVRTRYDF